MRPRLITAIRSESPRASAWLGDEDGGDAHRALDGPQLVAHLLAELLVEGGQRLVEEEHARAIDEGAGESHPLLHAARQLGRPLPPLPVQVHELEGLAHPARDLRQGVRRSRSPKATFSKTDRCGKSA